WWIHHNAKLTVNPSKCTGCGECLRQCPVGAIEIVGGKANIVSELCVDCAFCIDYCQARAFTSRTFPSIEEQEARVGESAAGIIDYFKGKAAFVNLAMDIVPLCDCDAFQGIPIVPDIGVLASKDPVALDRACVDLVNASPGIPGSMADEAKVLEPGAEKLNTIARMRWKATPGATHVAPDWKVMLQAAEDLGLGKQKYRLLRMNFGYPPKSIEELFESYEA
ncbi:4Fe-4S binding protein, partial [Candidatus Bathyarchaeota archaeon]|nr:4Fe-4S binding protein [Candidatus Bathyarchaeota archaeon]